MSQEPPTPSRAHRARFVVLDGIDGCGKSTQAKRLVERLAKIGALPPLHLREPGSTAAGERIRELVLSHEHQMDAGVELLLFAAARRQMLAEVVAPALREGRDVVCERFHASTFAYQAVAGGLPERDVLALLARWAGEPAPDRIVVIDVAPERAAGRRSRPGDRIEARGLEFQRRVAEGYRRYVELEPRAVRVDGEGTPDEVARRIAEAVGLGA
jgi:dTMP kinase